MELYFPGEMGGRGVWERGERESMGNFLVWWRGFGGRGGGPRGFVVRFVMLLLLGRFVVFFLF